MTPEAQRIAIAEGCGYTHRVCITGCGKLGWHADEGRCLTDFQDIPDYLNSLDAMHATEKTLGPKDYESFRWELWSLVKQPLVSEWNRAHLSATAAQRAEAFLRTLKLWNE